MPQKLPIWAYYLIPIAAYILFTLLVVPAIRERSISQTDYTTFLENVDDGKVSRAEIRSEYIYYMMSEDGRDTVYKTVRVEDPDLVSRLYEAGTAMEAVAICSPTRL